MNLIIIFGFFRGWFTCMQIFPASQSPPEFKKQNDHTWITQEVYWSLWRKKSLGSMTDILVKRNNNVISGRQRLLERHEKIFFWQITHLFWYVCQDMQLRTFSLALRNNVQCQCYISIIANCFLLLFYSFYEVTLSTYGNLRKKLKLKLI